MNHARPFFDTPALKAHRAGTTRTCTPEQTLAVVQPLLARFGVTRVANITGLDRVGIPVFQAVRPNSRSLSVSQGKGIDATSARVSAMMESLEVHHAEHARCSVVIDSQRDLARHARTVDARRLPLSRESRFDFHIALPWVAARDLAALAQDPVFVPFELVHANFTVPRVPGSGCFLASTNGLGSGNHMAEACLHGLCELIERDAETLWRLSSDADRAATRVEPDSVDCAEARAILDRLAAADLALMIWDITSDIGVACFDVVVFDPEADADLNPSPAADGSGCHPDRHVALCRALTEAAQSRLTAIAGSRDDLSAQRYRTFQDAAALDHYRAMCDAPRPRAFADAPRAVGETIDDDLRHVIDQLAARGLAEALFVDLSTPDAPMAFVRTIVPGLEGTCATAAYVPGARAMERLS